MRKVSKRFVSRSMVHRWMRKVSKRFVSRRRKKGETSTSLSTVHGSGLHAETGCRKGYAGDDDDDCF